MALYDPIAKLYDPWSRSVTEDVDFYVEEARAAGGPVVELAVGTGRIALPIAEAGIQVIGVDESPGMLAVAAAGAVDRGVERLLDLREGDLRRPPVAERVPLVICPFRALLHMVSEEQKLQALVAARDLLAPGGRYVFDVFTPSADDIAETHDVWFEREPGIHEHALWDEGNRCLTLEIVSGESKATMELHWLSTPEWRRLLDLAGLQIEALYGWFDRRPYEGGEDTVWVCAARDEAGPTGPGSIV